MSQRIDDPRSRQNYLVFEAVGAGLRKLIALSMLAIALVILSCAPSHATCNIGQDAKEISSLELGALRLDNIPRGGFRLLSQQAGTSSDAWRFELTGRSSSLSVTFRSAGTIVRASLQLRRPIFGTVRETLAAGACRRTFWIDRGTLTGARLKVLSGRLRADIAGELVAEGATFAITNNTIIVYQNNSVSGSIELRGHGFRMTRSIVAIPGVGDMPVEFRASGTVSVSIALESLVVHIENGALIANRVGSSNPVRLDSRYTITASKLNIASLILRVGGARPNLFLKGLRLSDATIEYSEFGKIAARKIPILTIDEISGPADIVKKIPVLDLANSEIHGLKGVALSLDILNSAGEMIASGSGNITIKLLNQSTISARLTLAKPISREFETSAYSGQFKNLSIGLVGSRQDPAIRVSAVLSSLRLGALSVTSSAINVEGIGQGERPLAIKAAIGKGEATLGKGEIVGSLFDVFIGAYLSGINETTRAVLAVKPGNLRAKFRTSATSFPLFGGKISFPPSSYQLDNDTDLTFGPETVAKLALGTVDASIDGVRLIPSEGESAVTFQTNVAHSAPNASLGITLDPGASLPILLTAHFEIPGFELKFPSIPFEIGSFEFSVSSFGVRSFAIDIWGAAASVAMNTITVGIDSFKPRKPKVGEPSPSLDVSGKSPEPFSIGKLQGMFDLSPWPPSFSDLAVNDLVMQTTDVSYNGPQELHVHASNADIKIPHAWLPSEHLPPHHDPYVSMSFVAKKTEVSWHGAPNGTANIDNLAVTLHGQPAHLDGKLDISSGVIALSGKANIPLGTKPDGNHGCTLTVPANVAFSILKLDGTINVIGGKPAGHIAVNDFNIGHIDYWGHQDCRWDQLVIIDVIIPYPCGFFKWCNTVEFDLGWVFAVKAVNLHFQPAVVEFQIGSDGGFEACKFSVAQILPIVPPVFSIAPQLPSWIGGDVARWINDLASVATGTVETLLTANALALESVISLVDFNTNGNGLNFTSKCNQ
ncbi:hypothetical protein FHT79_003243 [Rhizobium sp. BK212]|uniref:hypothetical protein n=1 Tax=Rhizobium sp. BK212 TaxID=2587074 RepID=UPI00161031BB|nr:hypothetical protein [Rhizobium sp. BK212]MBB4216056.1 hypothetical protein [Rhizobium sp. BK212]